MNILPLAVCLLLPGTDDTFLATSRRHSNALWGMPGGKVDPGESCEEALIREVKEETGYVFRKSEITPLYSGICEGETTFWVTTFIASPGSGVHIPSLAIEHDINYQMQPIEVFLNVDTSPFALYNQHVFTIYDQIRSRK